MSSSDKNDTKDSELGPAVTTSEGEMVSVPSPRNLDRGFKGRQVNMLAIAGAIGTGLIIGTGQGLARGGPAGLFIAYCITGSTIYFVMTALGEMSAFLPMDQGFSGYAERFIDPALGYVRLFFTCPQLTDRKALQRAGTTSSNTPLSLPTTSPLPASSFNTGDQIST